MTLLGIDARPAVGDLVGVGSHLAYAIEGAGRDGHPCRGTRGRRRAAATLGRVSDPLVIEARAPGLGGRLSHWLRGRRLMIAGILALAEVVAFVIWRPSAVLMAALAIAVLVVAVMVAIRIPRGVLRDLLWIVVLAEAIVVVIPLLVGLSLVAGLLAAAALIVVLIFAAARWRV